MGGAARDAVSSGTGRGRIASRGSGALVCLSLFGVLALAGCQTPPWNSVRKARAEAERQRAGGELQDHRDRVLAIQLETAELRDRARVEEAALRKARSEANTRTIELDQQLRQLRAAEEDLAATKERRSAAEASIRELEVLEARAASSGPKKAELEKQVAAVEAELKVFEEQKQAQLAELNRLKEKAAAESAKAAALIEQLKASLGEAQPKPAAPAAGDPKAAAPKPGDPNKK